MELISGHYKRIKAKFFCHCPKLQVFFYDRHPKLRRIIKFGIAGAISTVADLFLLWLFYGAFKMELIFSTSAAFILSFVISFVLQKYWTFSNWNRELMYQQMFSYLMFAFFNLNINGWAMHLFVNTLGIQYLLSQIIVAGLIGAESFFVYKFFIFRTYENKVPGVTAEPNTGEVTE